MNAGTLLVIDDDAAFNGVLCHALVRRGYNVCSAGNAQEALATAEQERPGLIVLDLNLAGDSGLALVAPLKRACPEGRIVVLTGYASIATAVEAIKLGATHYLAKPVDVDTLLAAFDPESGEPAGAAAGSPPREPLSVERLEWEHIQRVMLENDNNISATARALKMHRRTLQRKLAKKPARE